MVLYKIPLIFGLLHGDDDREDDEILFGHCVYFHTWQIHIPSLGQIGLIRLRRWIDLVDSGHGVLMLQREWKEGGRITLVYSYYIQHSNLFYFPFLSLTMVASYLRKGSYIDILLNFSWENSLENCVLVYFFILHMYHL